MNIDFNHAPSLCSRRASLVAMQLLMLLLVAALNVPAYAQGALGKTFNYTVLIESEHLDNYIHFSGSKLDPTVRVKVKYYQDNDQANAILYEELWYRSGDIVGYRRQNELKIGKMKTVALCISHKGNLIQGESDAATDAAVRLWLETKIQGSSPMAVMAPNISFDSVSDRLTRYNFRSTTMTPDEPVSAVAMLYLYGTEDSNRSKIFGYKLHDD